VLRIFEHMLDLNRPKTAPLARPHLGLLYSASGRSDDFRILSGPAAGVASDEGTDRMRTYLWRCSKKVDASGVAAVLIGESLLRAGDIAGKIRELFGS
jgi:hypothetical protein